MIRQSRNRDHKLEYRRRIERGLAAGLSRSAARGHARAGERAGVSVGVEIDPLRPEERAIKRMRSGVSLRAAASAEQLSQERLRRYLKENTNAVREGQRWFVPDLRLRRFPIYSSGRLITLELGVSQVSRAAIFMHAVKEFLLTGNADLLAPFSLDGVRDVRGKFHPFEVDENTLYELDAAGELSFPELYRIVS